MKPLSQTDAETYLEAIPRLPGERIRATIIVPAGIGADVDPIYWLKDWEFLTLECDGNASRYRVILKHDNLKEFVAALYDVSGVVMGTPTAQGDDCGTCPHCQNPPCPDCSATEPTEVTISVISGPHACDERERIRREECGGSTTVTPID